MTSETITGTVEQIALEDSFTRPMGHATEVAQSVRATLALDDGRKAYVTTGVGAMTYYQAGVIGPAGAEHWHSNVTDGNARDATDGRWPWAIESGIQIAVPSKGSPFEGTTAYPYSRGVLTVWEGDRITITGTVEVHTSKHGTEYLTVKRAQVVAMDRPRDSHRWEGMPEGRGERRLRLRQELESLNESVQEAFEADRGTAEIRARLEHVERKRDELAEFEGRTSEAA